jgi:hypothetical protein
MVRVVMRRILPGLRDSQCVVALFDAGLYFGPDTHMFALGRLVQPDLLTLLDIGECQCPLQCFCLPEQLELEFVSELELELNTPWRCPSPSLRRCTTR